MTISVTAVPMLFPEGRDWRLAGAGVALLVLVLDQLSKAWLLGVLAANPGGIEVTSFFNLVMVWNSGVSFGLFGEDSESRRWLLIAVTLTITATLVIWLWRRPAPLVALALGAVIGGAVGNVIDRLRFGAVADFLDFHAFGWHWPAFNVADSAIVAGVALMLVDSLRAR